MRTAEQWYVLRRARHGLRPRPEMADAAQSLMAEGLLEIRSGWLGPRWYATRRGLEQLRRAQHSSDKLARAVALGELDHVPYDLFVALAQSPDLDRYLEGQKRARRLLLMAFGLRRI